VPRYRLGRTRPGCRGGRCTRACAAPRPGQNSRAQEAGGQLSWQDRPTGLGSGSTTFSTNGERCPVRLAASTRPLLAEVLARLLCVVPILEGDGRLSLFDRRHLANVGRLGRAVLALAHDGLTRQRESPVFEVSSLRLLRVSPPETHRAQSLPSPPGHGRGWRSSSVSVMVARAATLASLQACCATVGRGEGVRSGCRLVPCAHYPSLTESGKPTVRLFSMHS
jgi:hypothetical protein